MTDPSDIPAEYANYQGYSIYGLDMVSVPVTEPFSLLLNYKCSLNQKMMMLKIK